MSTVVWVLIGRPTQHHDALLRGSEGPLRLAVRRDPRVSAPWRWSVYDMTRGSKTGGLKVQTGVADSWREGRATAEAAAYGFARQRRQLMAGSLEVS